MRRTLLLPLLALAACQAAGGGARVLAPLGQEGEVYLYLAPLAADASGLALSVEAVAVAGADGTAVPLEVTLPELSGEDVPRQRLLAWGRVRPGIYGTLLVRFKRATVRGLEGRADLLVGADAARVSIPLTVSSGHATVLALQLDAERSLGPSHQFTPALSAAIPTTGIVPVTGYCSNTGMASVTVFDRHARRVVAAFPVGREPEGIALDLSRSRAYLALSGDDQIEAIDLATGTDLGRVRLRTGDRPRELALSGDGRQLLVINEGSNTLAFVDVDSLSEAARVQTGLEPRALLLDRASRRAYALSRRSTSITVVDLGYRSVVGTIATEGEPLRAQVSRAGDRLYVVSAGSSYMAVYGLPDLGLQSRVFVGMGAGALKVDPRSDLVYVGGRDEELVQVFAPLSPLPIDRIDLPSGASFLTIDDTENALVALLPGRRSVAYVDLASRRVVGQVECGFDPYQVTVVGER